jgi:hypothetical protein
MAKRWTFPTLIVWIKAELNAIRGVLEERAKAITVAFDNFEKRMDGTNEWRAAFNDLTKTMASQEALDALAAQVRELKDKDTKSGGKAAGFSQLATIIATSLATGAAMVAIFAAMNGAG